MTTTKTKTWNGVLLVVLVGRPNGPVVFAKRQSIALVPLPTASRRQEKDPVYGVYGMGARRGTRQERTRLQGSSSYTQRFVDSH
eukprot:scaffold160_cov139-Amphora_coffeaeformis.AAC.6